MNFNFIRSPFRVNTTINPRSGRRTEALRRASYAAMYLAALALVVEILHTSPVNAQQRRVEPQQERPAVQISAPEPVNARININPEKDYLISAGDVIQIQIEDAPELSHQYQVSASGRIEMPVLGMVEAKKKTTYELARLIQKGLREGEYLNNPSVLITIKEYNKQTFFIQGSVRNPGIIQAEGRPSLLTIIGMAGGLVDGYGPIAFILRPSKAKRLGPETDNQIASLQDQTLSSDQSGQPQTAGIAAAPAADPDYEVIRVNISALLKGQLDQKMEPGDTINIPRADVFFISGEVRAPGSFPLKEGTTLRQAVSLAQGMTFNAKPSQGVIFREDSAGARQEIKVDISAVMSGKKEDIQLLANDVIIIPNSRTKSVGSMLLQALGVNSARIPVR